MDPLHIETPLHQSLALGERLGTEVWLKLEALQPSGSFKTRGIGAACQVYAAGGAERFVSSSGGNAGLAVAYSGRRLGIPVLVVVPESTPDRARHLIAQEGAELVVHGASWQEANAHARQLLRGVDAFLHPFDDPLIWRGHSTLVDELAAVRFRPGAVVVSVGGGGLLCGVLEGLQRHGWSEVPVFAVETRGADSLSRALAAGAPVELPAITSVATTLGARRVCERALELSLRPGVRSLVVSDAQALAACRRFLDDHRLLVEPACGAALASLEVFPGAFTGLASVLVVVCGGSGITLESLTAMTDAVTRQDRSN